MSHHSNLTIHMDHKTTLFTESDQAKHADSHTHFTYDQKNMVTSEHSKPGEGQHPHNVYDDHQSMSTFLLLFDRVSGSSKVHYHMVDPSSNQKIFPKGNTFIASRIKDMCGYKPIVFNGCLYIIGGKEWNTGSYSARVSKYDPWLNTWMDVKSLLVARSGCTAEVIGTYLFVIGGLVKGQRVTDTVERYDSSTNEWTQVATLPFPRVDHASCVINNVIYVSGGSSDLQYPGSNTFWYYDTEVNQWRDVEEGETYLPHDRSNHVMCPVDNNRIILLGGQVFDHESYSEMDEADIYQYNLPDCQISNEPRKTWYMDHPRMTVPRCNSSIVLIGTNIWIIGGFSYNKRTPIKLVTYYDTVLKRWRNAFHLPDHHYANMEGVLLDVPTTNTSFIFKDKFIYRHWVMW